MDSHKEVNEIMRLPGKDNNRLPEGPERERVDYPE